MPTVRGAILLCKLQLLWMRWLPTRKLDNILFWSTVQYLWQYNYRILWNTYTLLQTNFVISTNIFMGARGGAVGWGTALQAVRSLVRFSMLSLKFLTMNKKSTRCTLVLKALKLYCIPIPLYMFWAPLRPSSGASQFCT
jgi:hypothetical protein